MPLYYQLQEILKEQIESGLWQPGESLPSEPELARRFGVSRVVVRQALGILAADRQIERVRGRGTFVAPPKLEHRAGGLTRLLVRPRSPGVAIRVLDIALPQVEQSIRDGLRADVDDDILRVTTLLSLRGKPLSIAYAFLRRREAEWLESNIVAGREIPRGLTLSGQGIELAHSEISIETTECGQFDADHFGIPNRSAVFLVRCTEFQAAEPPVPLEVARVAYRGDIVQFRLEVTPDERSSFAATWSVT